MSTNITYNSYNFRTQGGPIPFLTINKSLKQNGAGLIIGSQFQISLNGTLTPLPSGAIGYTNIDGMQDALLSAFSTTGRMIVTCNGDTLMDVLATPTRINIPPSNDNWVQTAPYSIDLLVDGEAISGSVYVDEIDESWTIQVDESTSVYDWSYSGSGDRNSTVLNISHELSAKGVAHLTATGYAKPAWQQAKDWVVGQLGITNDDFASYNVINLDPSKFSHFNHIRVDQRNEQAGTYSVNESWISLDTSVAGTAGNGIEDFTANVRQDQENGLTTVDIQGSIRGLEQRNMSGAVGSFAITTSKYTNASGCWNNIRPKIYNRAKLIGAGISNRTINPQPLSFSVGHNPTQGSINYSYSYDNRPCNIIDGATFERINIVNIYPNDVFARIPVLGRANGPILQDIGTVTESRRAVNIDIVVPITGNCSISNILSSPKAQVDDFLCQIQQDIDGADVTWFLSSDQDSWDPKFGRYTRTVEFVYTNCEGTPPSTDFC